MSDAKVSFTNPHFSGRSAILFDTYEKVIQEDLLRIRNGFPSEAASRNWTKRATLCVVSFVDHDGGEYKTVLSQRVGYPDDDAIIRLFSECTLVLGLWENLFDLGRGLLPRSIAVAVVYMAEIRLEFYDESFRRIGEFSMRPSEVVEF